MRNHIQAEVHLNKKTYEFKETMLQLGNELTNYINMSEVEGIV